MHRGEAGSAGRGGPIGRLRAVAGATAREAMRTRLPFVAALLGAGLVALAPALRDLNFGAREADFLAEFGVGAITVAAMGFAVLAATHLVFADFDGGMALVVLSRPLRRWEYVGGKLAGVGALLAGLIVVLGIILAFLVCFRARQLAGPGPALPALLQACGLVWFQATLVAAMTLLVCTYAGSALFADCVGLVLAVYGQLHPLLPRAGWPAVLRLGPNLAVFTLDLAGGGDGLGWAGLLGLLGYWASYLVLLTGLAAYVLKHREF